MEINGRIKELERQIRQLNELKASLKEEAKDNRPITERVKTFKDACRALGDNHQFVSEWSVVSEITNISPDLRAFFKLRIITAALNEGWEPQFTEDEYRYFPWFYLYTQEEWGKLDEEKKESGVLFGGHAYYGADAGFVFARSSSAPSYARAYFGSRLCFKTDALARYAGRQFTALYADYLLVRK